MHMLNVQLSFAVQQLLFATVMITLEVMSLGSELGSTKFTGKHSLNVELQSLDSYQNAGSHSFLKFQTFSKDICLHSANKHFS